MVVHLNSLSFALAINHPNGALLIQQLVAILEKSCLRERDGKKIFLNHNCKHSTVDLSVLFSSIIREEITYSYIKFMHISMYQMIEYQAI